MYDINILLELSLMKSLYAHWLLESYNQMGTIEGTDIILSVWTAFSIGDALKSGKFCLQPLDSFHDIQLTVESDEKNVDIDLRAVCELNDSQISIRYSPKTDWRNLRWVWMGARRWSEMERFQKIIWGYWWTLDVYFFAVRRNIVSKIKQNTWENFFLKHLYLYLSKSF